MIVDASAILNYSQRVRHAKASASYETAAMTVAMATIVFSP